MSWAEFDALVADGMSEVEAYAEAFDLDVEQVRREDAIARLRSQGYRGHGFEQLARAAYYDYLRGVVERAEQDCRGELLNRRAQQRGIHPIDLWASNPAYAYCWASEELREWWDTHGRVSFPVFREWLLTGRALAPGGGATWAA